ncbi:tyrosyl-DNA phosphodiesterase 1-like isoform X2 [Homarus americanus]|nr:tyrosyl-DNA phosphodiesterase 1-like isoform X2 [Homarus americanus]
MSETDDDDEEEEEEQEEEEEASSRSGGAGQVLQCGNTATQASKNYSEASPSCHKDGVTNSPKTPPKKRPPCEYGSSCYRKNPLHLKEFYHPPLEGGEKETVHKRNKECTPGTAGPPKKRLKESVPVGTSQKISSSKLPFPARLSASEPFNFFLNKTFSIKETQEDPLALVFPDLLNPQLGELVESAQLNFMVDLEFLMENYKAGQAHTKPLLVMYGEMEGDPKAHSSVVCNKVKISFQYGTHHTKIMLFQYKTGCRVVVHTANLVPDDWYEKTQGYWVSPVFPELENGRESLLDGESPTRFKRDLVDYLLAYKVPDLTRWANLVKKYDFSNCNAVFVGSVPGYHRGESKDRWGHMKVRRVMKQHASSWKSSLPILFQCSSIGSLGKDARSWMSGELGMSLTGVPGVCASAPMVNLVYPSEDDICNSSQGWMGGSCLPYNSATHEKQPWLMQHLHLWRSDKRHRTKAMPHIKCYTRVNMNCSAAQFFLLTSANLSKAAWGTLQIQNSQLFIRSYEAGVLLLPKFVNDNTEFELGSPSSPSCLSLPYDVPLRPYPDGATPWFMNTRKKRSDIFGRTYP